MASFGSSKLESLGLSAPLATFDPVSRMKTKSSAPLGIFDSGVGGITVLQELYRQLPQESIVYFGDTARLPYGDRSPQEIVQYVREILNWMALQGVKMVIMACNTSSALALDEVRSDYPFPILGVILPGAKAAAQAGRRIGVLATPATASSHAYRQAILEIIPKIKPDAIVHTAAQPSHDRAASIPFEDFDTNAVGTFNLLESLRRYSTDIPFVHLSTNKVYGDAPNF